jgi:very-short-patch-repair endonuclease
VHRGVYAVVTSRALPPLAIEQAAVLAMGPNSYISHHSSAALWGIRPAAGQVEVTVVGREPASRKGIRVHCLCSLDRRDRRLLERIPIISAARTLLDIAVDLSDRELERAFDEGIATRKINETAVRGVLDQYPRRPGAARLRAIASPGRSLTMTRSESEERFLELLRKADLPRPEVNARVGRFEVDFCWRRERVIVEIDGYSFHSSRAALARDHRRDAELQQMGFVVIRILARELIEAPERVLVRAASALALRAAA